MKLTSSAEFVIDTDLLRVETELVDESNEPAFGLIVSPSGKEICLIIARRAFMIEFGRR